MGLLDLLNILGIILPLLCWLNPFCLQYYETVAHYMVLINNGTAKAYTNTLPTDASAFTPTSNACSDYGAFDYIIVGAGSTGCVIASRLSENPNTTVLLLEAGGNSTEFTDIPGLNDFLMALEFNWNYNTTPQQNTCQGMIDAKCPHATGKGLGGSSLVGFLRYERGNSRDYDNWADQGNPGWSYNDVLPYFIKSEHSEINGDPGYHGTQGPWNVEYLSSNSYSKYYNAFIQANNLKGVPTVDYNGRNQLGVSPIQTNTVNGARASLAKTYLFPAANRPNLVVSTYSYVRRININSNSLTALGVTFDRGYDGQCLTTTARKEVIASAGAIGSPQLLLRSGIGPTLDLNQLGIPTIHDLSVGLNLQYHPVFMPLNFETNYTQPSGTLEKNVEGFLNGSGVLTAAGNQQGMGYYQTNLTNTLGYPDVQILLVPCNGTEEIMKKTLHYTDETFEAAWGNVDGSRCFTFMLTLLRPKSRGSVKLSSANPYQYPSIDAGALSDPEGIDLETMYQAIQIALGLVNTAPFQKFNTTLVRISLPSCEGFAYLSRDYWYCCIKHLTIPTSAVGSCKMGPDPLQGAVVNNEAKVYGVNNLRVADASIIPETTSGEHNAPCVMIGEKVSDLIRNSQ